MNTINVQTHLVKALFLINVNIACKNYDDLADLRKIYFDTDFRKQDFFLLFLKDFIISDSGSKLDTDSYKFGPILLQRKQANFSNIWPKICIK